MKQFILILIISLLFIFVPTALINASEINFPAINVDREQKFVVKSVPSNSNAFAYMGYTTITSRGSKQYKLQQIAYTDIYGIRCVQQYYLVAMGTYYGKVGDTFKIHTASGGWYMVMMGDVKSDVHTDTSNRVSGDGSIIEFIVDRKVIKTHKDFGRATEHLRDTIIKIEKEIQ